MIVWLLQVHPSKVIAWAKLGKRKVPLELVLLLRLQQVAIFPFLEFFAICYTLARCLVLSRYSTSLNDETVSFL